MDIDAPALPDTSGARPFKVAVVQMFPAFGAMRTNLDAIFEHMRSSAEQGAELVVFPECALSGYVYTGVDEAWPSAIMQQSMVTERLAEVCQETNVFAV